MPEDINVGRLVAEIVLDSSGVEDGSKRSEEALEDVRYALKYLGVDGEKAEDILKKCFSDTSKIEAYTGKMDAVSRKMDEYQQKLSPLIAEEKELQKHWEEMNRASGSDHPYISQHAEEIESLNRKLSEQQAKYDGIQSSFDGYVRKIVEGYDKQSAAAEQAAKKQEELNQKLSGRQVRSDIMGMMSLTGTALRNLKGLTPEISGSLTTIIFNIRAIRSAMKQGQSTAMLWGSVIVSAVGAILNVIQNAFDKYYQEMDKATEKIRADMDKMIENAKEYTKELNDLLKERDKQLASPMGEDAKLRAQLSVYDELRTKTWLTTEEQERLDMVAQALADTMGLSEVQLKSLGGTYRDLTQDVDEYIKKLQEQARQEYYADVIKESAISVERLKAPVKEAEDAWKEAEAELDILKSKFKEIQGFDFEDERTKKLTLWDVAEITEAQKKTDELRKAYAILKSESVLAEVAGENAANAVSGAADEAKDTVSGAADWLSELSKAGTAAAAIVISGMSAQSESAKKAEEAYQTAAEKAEAWKEKLAEANKTLDAQSSELKRLTEERKTAQAALSAAAMAAAAGDKEAAKSLTELQTRLGNLKIRICDLSAEMTMQRRIVAWVKTEYERLEKAARPLSEKLQDTAKSSSSLRSEMNTLGSTMKQLSQGEAISLSTLLELIDKYPEYASELSAAAGNADLQRQALEKLFEAKKNEYILTQQSAIDNIEASQKETKVRLENLRSQIKAYEQLGSVIAGTAAIFGSAIDPAKLIGAILKPTVQSAQEVVLQNELDKLDKQVESYRQKIKLINGLKISDFGSSADSGSSKEKTALQQYLDQLDDMKELDQLSLKSEIASYEWALRHYSATSEEKHDVEVRLYRARKKLAEEEEKEQEDRRKKEIESLNDLGDAVTAALKNKYQQQKSLEEQRIEESIRNWKNWEDETVSAIQGQIDALDDLKDAHDEENKRAEYEQKRQAMELELRYEKDAYNRKQIQKQIAALDKEENERLYDVGVESRKKALQEQQKAAQQLSSDQQEALRSRKDSVSQQYDKLMTDIALQGEARRMILSGSQQELTQLINTYAPEFEMLGTKLGESLYDSFRSKTGSIVDFVDKIAQRTDTNTERQNAAALLMRYGEGTSDRMKLLDRSYSVIYAEERLKKITDQLFSGVSLVTGYKNRLSSAANTAADHYYLRTGGPSASENSVSSPKTINVYMTANFNGQVDSPVQVKRQMESLGYEIARQIG